MPNDISELAGEVASTQPEGGAKRIEAGPDSRSLDIIRLYLSQIGEDVDLLTADEEKDLGYKMRAGLIAQEAKKLGMAYNGLRVQLGYHPAEIPPEIDQQITDGDNAKDRFIRANTKLVVSIAKRYKYTNLPLEDRIQDGAIGLIRAVEKFDPDKEFKFSTYATWWIRQAITRGIKDTERSVRIPSHMGDFINQVTKGQSDLLEELGREPSMREIADRLGVNQHKVLDALMVAQAVISLDMPIGEDGSGVLGDILSVEGQVDPEEQILTILQSHDLKIIIDNAKLTPKEYNVISLRFGLEDGVIHTLDEVGRKFRVSRERIRQIEKKVLIKLATAAGVAPPKLEK